MTSRTAKWSVFGLVALFVAAGGCDDDDGGSTGGTDAGGGAMDAAMGGEDAGGTPATASVRVLHLSPDAPAVDVFANAGADPAVSGLEFTQGTGYLEVAQPATTWTSPPAPTPWASTSTTTRRPT